MLDSPNLPKNDPSVSGVDSCRLLHRIQLIRRREDISLRAAARRIGSTIRKLRRQEVETDIYISDLGEWARALGVPVAELLEESCDGTPETIRLRAGLVRVMKTVKAMIDSEDSVTVRPLVSVIERQLLEIMPELVEVSPWNAYVNEGTRDNVGRAVQPYHVADPELRRDA